MSLSDEPGSNKCQVRSGVVAHGCTWSQSRPLVTPDDFLGIYIHPTRFRKGAAQKVQKFNSWTFGVVSSKITMRCDSQGVYKGFSNINHLFWGTPILGNTHIYFKLLISRNSMSFRQIDIIIWGKFWWFDVKRDGGIHDKTVVFHNQLSSHQDIGRLVV